MDKDFYSAVDRINLVDERLAYEMMKQNYPNYKNCKTEYEFWKGYIETANKNNIDYYVPFSFLMKYVNNAEKLEYNYAIIRLVHYLTDIDKPVFVGLDFSQYQRFETDLIAVAEYLTKTWKICFFEKKFIMHIKYRKDLGGTKNVFIVKDGEQLKAYVENDIVDVAQFQYDRKTNEYPIPLELSRRVIDCINTDFRKYTLTQQIHEDDRCFMSDSFSIYVPEKYLNLPKTKGGWYHHSPSEYFHSERRSAFPAFNELLSYIYDSMEEYERELFPFKA